MWEPCQAIWGNLETNEMQSVLQGLQSGKKLRRQQYQADLESGRQVTRRVQRTDPSLPTQRPGEGFMEEATWR